MITIARFTIWVCAWIVPPGARSQWREEWTAELARIGSQPARRRRRQARQAILGVPLDAVAMRRHRSGHGNSKPFSQIGADCRHALRTLSASPGNAAGVVLCCAVGLVFSVLPYAAINSVLFADPPGIEGRTGLSRVYLQQSVGPGTAFVGALSQDQLSILSHPSVAIAGVAAEGGLDLPVRLAGDTLLRVHAAFVSRHYFAVLGTRASNGRLLGLADAHPAAASIILGHELWRDRFGADPSVLGSSVLVAGQPMQIVGIAPPQFTGWHVPTPLEDNPARRNVKTELWLPLEVALRIPGTPPPSRAWLTTLVRRTSAVSESDASAALRSRLSLLRQSTPSSRIEAIVLRNDGLGTADGDDDVALAVGVMMLAPLLVLGVACANAAGLRLASAAIRAPELGLRLALGASRARIVRLLTMESAMLAAAALALAWMLATLLLDVSAPYFPVPIKIDTHVAVVAIALTVGVIGAAGLGPAWLTSGRILTAGLRQGQLTGRAAHSRLRASVLIAQIAVSVALVLSCLLLARSARAVRAETPAFAAGVVTAQVDLSTLGYDNVRAQQFGTELATRLRTAGGVSGAGLADVGVFDRRETLYRRPGTQFQRPYYAQLKRVTQGWFEALDIRAVDGAMFADRDRGVAVVDQRFVNVFSPGQSPIGLVIEVLTPDRRTPEQVRIVGVVSVGPMPLGQGTASQAIYMPLTETPTTFHLVARVDDGERVTSEVRTHALALEPRGPSMHVTTAAEEALEHTLPWRLFAGASGVLGGGALTLAMGGLFAMTAFMVARRTHEIGVRMAVGATAADIATMVLAQNIRLVAAGGTIGTTLAILIAQVAQSAIVGISPADPWSIGAVVAILALATIAAGLVPARRAARVDPIKALRAE